MSIIDPSPTDAGSAFLGAVLGTNGVVLDETGLTPDDFADPVHGRIFEAATNLRETGRPVDLVTLSNALPEHMGARVTELLAFTSLTYNAEAHAEIILDTSMRRRVAEAGAQISALGPELDAAEVVDRAQAILEQAISRSDRASYRFVRELVDDVLVSVVEEGTFIQSPWRALNTAIGGFRPGCLYVVAARPAVGKTVIAAQIATALAEKGAVAFSSLEMSASELVQRLISERALVSVGHLKHNRMTERDLDLIAQKRSVIDGLNIAIDDRTDVSPKDVRAFVRSLSKKQPIAGVVVDYLQLMSSRSKANRYEQVTEFSRQMKVLAKDFEVPVILLSQLNREVENRTDGIPKMSDLRESGAIEQDADAIIMLRREGESPNERIFLDVVKNRHGDVYDVELDWQGYYSRAVNLDA